MSNIEGMYPDYLYGDIQIVRAARGACPVCGHPTGDCATDTSKPKHVIGFGIFKSVDKTLDFLVEEDIYEDRQINPHYNTRVLVARKGQRIPLDRARELGLL